MNAGCSFAIKIPAIYFKFSYKGRAQAAARLPLVSVHSLLQSFIDCLSVGVVSTSLCHWVHGAGSYDHQDTAPPSEGTWSPLGEMGDGQTRGHDQNTAWHGGSNGWSRQPRGVWCQEGFLEELLLELSIGGQVGARHEGSREARHV